MAIWVLRAIRYHGTGGNIFGHSLQEEEMAVKILANQVGKG